MLPMQRLWFLHISYIFLVLFLNRVYVFLIFIFLTEWGKQHELQISKRKYSPLTLKYFSHKFFIQFLSFWPLLNYLTQHRKLACFSSLPPIHKNLMTILQVFHNHSQMKTEKKGFNFHSPFYMVLNKDIM